VAATFFDAGAPTACPTARAAFQSGGLAPMEVMIMLMNSAYASCPGSSTSQSFTGTATHEAMLAVMLAGPRLREALKSMLAAVVAPPCNCFGHKLDGAYRLYGNLADESSSSSSAADAPVRLEAGAYGGSSDAYGFSAPQQYNPYVQQQPPQQQIPMVVAGGGAAPVPVTALPSSTAAGYFPMNSGGTGIYAGGSRGGNSIYGGSGGAINPYASSNNPYTSSSSMYPVPIGGAGGGGGGQYGRYESGGLMMTPGAPITPPAGGTWRSAGNGMQYNQPYSYNGRTPASATYWRAAPPPPLPLPMPLGAGGLMQQDPGWYAPDPYLRGGGAPAGFGAKLERGVTSQRPPTSVSMNGGRSRAAEDAWGYSSSGGGGGGGEGSEEDLASGAFVVDSTEEDDSSSNSVPAFVVEVEPGGSSEEGAEESSTEVRRVGVGEGFVD